MALVVDTGPMLALLDRNDRDHARCLAMLGDVHDDLVIPSPTLVELNHWLRKRGVLHVWRQFVDDVVTGAYRLYRLDEEDLLRAAQLEVQYASLDLGHVAAAVIVTCEHLGETKVATLNRRDFAVVRPRHCDRLELLPG